MVFYFKQFFKNKTAATAIEYAYIASLVSVMLVAGALIISGKLSGTFSDVAGNMK